MVRKIFISLLLILVSASAKSTQIWFSPNNTDLINSIENDGEWATSRENIKVFKFYYQIIIYTPTSILKDKFKYLEDNNIKVAIEWPVLTWEEQGVGYKIEGFQEKGFSQKIIDKVKLANGRIDYIALDEPLFYASYKKGKNFPSYTLDTLAKKVVENLRPVYSSFPDVKVGDIEPVDQITDVSYKDLVNQWVNAFKKENGKGFDFFHADVVWRGNWLPVLDFLSTEMKKKNIRFGVIFNSGEPRAEPYKWMMSARSNIRDYLSSSLPIPDDVVFQSWNRSPRAILPDTDPHAHSSLIRYFRTEVKLRR